MAQPQAYNRETDFTERDGDDTNHPGINIELDAAAQSINEIRDNLALIQRDDGALQNGIVTAESLAPSAFDAVLVEVNLAVTDAQTAATSANNAAVSANTARDQAVAAKDTAVTSASAAALNATTATTKASEAAASATASATSATNSATSATNSANSATTATTKAAEAVTSASNAAASATAAAASQTAAATSATNAASLAATATTQAATATTQASNAAASATAAAASFDEFDDRYLGSKTSDPTTDNDGNALLSGALYFNSVAGEMRVWSGTFWKATGSSVGGTINTAKYTATAGQTTFAIVYDVGFVHVYLNGVKLESGVEFTANNGTSVILATGATAGDVVDMIAFGIFSVANTYTKAEADALLGAKANTTDVNTALATKQAADVELTTLAGMSASRATYLAGTEGFGFRNRIINGDMRIDQRNAGASVTWTGPASNYVADRFIVGLFGSTYSNPTITAQQMTDAPPGFTNSLKITSSSTVVPDANKLGAWFEQRLEGFNVADLAWGTASASAITVQFRVKASKTGTVSVSVENSANDRSYLTTVSIVAANTWETKTVTIPGDTSGTWLTNSGQGISLKIGAMSNGSWLAGNGGAWSSTRAVLSTSQTNFIAASGDNIAITGVQLEAGTVATPFERRDYGRELMMCERYLEYSFAAARGAGYGSILGVTCNFAVTKRATPTVTFSSLVQGENISGNPYVNTINVSGFQARCNTTTGTGGDFSAIYKAEIEL